MGGCCRTQGGVPDPWPAVPSRGTGWEASAGSMELVHPAQGAQFLGMLPDALAAVR